MPIEWRKPCAETTVHYGYVAEKKRFSLFFDRDAGDRSGRWILRDYDANWLETTEHLSMRVAQDHAAVIM